MTINLPAKARLSENEKEENTNTLCTCAALVT